MSKQLVSYHVRALLAAGRLVLVEPASSGEPRLLVVAIARAGRPLALRDDRSR